MVRLITFEEGGSRRIGVELSDGGDVADVTKQDDTENTVAVCPLTYQPF